jgi:hypothetical protein
VTRARGRFAERLDDARTPRRSRTWWVPLGAVLAAAALAVTLRSRPGAPADFVQTAAAEDVLDNSDGSEVRRRASSELRVLAVTTMALTWRWSAAPPTSRCCTGRR